MLVVMSWLIRIKMGSFAAQNTKSEKGEREKKKRKEKGKKKINISGWNKH
jgi:hypothetical protein